MTFTHSLDHKELKISFYIFTGSKAVKMNFTHSLDHKELKMTFYIFTGSQ